MVFLKFNPKRNLTKLFGNLIITQAMQVFLIAQTMTETHLPLQFVGRRVGKEAELGIRCKQG